MTAGTSWRRPRRGSRRSLRRFAARGGTGRRPARGWTHRRSRPRGRPSGCRRSRRVGHRCGSLRRGCRVGPAARYGGRNGPAETAVGRSRAGCRRSTPRAGWRRHRARGGGGVSGASGGFRDCLGRQGVQHGIEPLAVESDADQIIRRGGQQQSTDGRIDDAVGDVAHVPILRDLRIVTWGAAASSGWYGTS